jgi:gas vesicle protein
MLHEVSIRTQKAKDPVTIINHHGLVKLIVNKALSQTQLTWGDLIEANRPLQLEQPELYHEDPPQEIEEIQEGEATAQIEVPPPQPEVEADPIQITETQTSQAEALTRKRKRETTAPKAPIERKRRSRWTRHPEEIQEMTEQIQEMTEEIQDTTKQPEEIQDITEQSLQENVQEIEQAEQTSQGNSQEDTQPALEHLTEQFLKSYEVEIAQVLGSLGTSIDRDTNKPEEYQERASSSKPAEDFPDIEMSFPEDADTGRTSS